jgi:hypothetical protein
MKNYCQVLFVICQINARKWIKLHGQLKKSDPNGVKQDKVTGSKRKIGESSGGRGVTQIGESSGGRGVTQIYSVGHQGMCFISCFTVS